MARKTDNFSKFFNKKKNSAIKEEIRQEKKAIKKERKDAIERHFEEKRRLKYGGDAPEKRPERPFQPVEKKGKEFKPGKPIRTERTADRTFEPRKEPAGSVPFAKERREEKGAPAKKETKTRGGVEIRKSIEKKGSEGKGYAAPKESSAKEGLAKEKELKPANSIQGKPGKDITGKDIHQSKGIRNPKEAAKAPGKGKASREAGREPAGLKGPEPAKAADTMPLNKYIAHGGICSRRDAAELIKQGKVLVNGKAVTEPGTKVFKEDLVKVNGKKVIISRDFVYILLNKPKDYITTTDDPQGRRTVLDLIRQATRERVYPVGRLDRNTSGVLLLTNDGELSQKLAHPKHEIKKIYHVTLDKALTKTDFDKIIEGVTLEDGIAYIDAIAYADAKDKTQVGLEIHSGRNRIVRRIFEHLGYDVRGLDRVMYAGLTKKNVQRGKWRLLSEKEVRILKYLNSSK